MSSGGIRGSSYTYQTFAACIHLQPTALHAICFINLSLVAFSSKCFSLMLRLHDQDAKFAFNNTV